MSKIIQLAKKIDFFGKPFIFEEKENNKYTTLLGTLMTLLIIITCIVMGFLFGREIFERKNPSVLTSDEIIDVSRVNMTDFPIFFTFKKGSGQYQPLAKKHMIMEISFLTLSKDNEIKSYFYEGFKKCEVSEYSENYHQYIQDIYDDIGNNHDLYCINRNDIYVQNRYADTNSALINVRFRLCDQVFDKGICVDIEEGKKMINDLYIYYIYIDSYIDSSDYNKPTNYFTAAKSQKVGPDFLQINYFSIQNTKLITNKGWLLDNKKEEEHYSIQSIVKEVTNTYNGNAFWLAMDSPNFRPKIIRSYTKIQDVIAKIGGFFNGLYICTLIITKNFINFSFYSYIYTYFTDIYNPNNNNKEISKATNTNHFITTNTNNNNNNVSKKNFIRLSQSNVISEVLDKNRKNDSMIYLSKD